MPDPEEALGDSMDPDDMFDPFAACECRATRASVDSTTEDHLCEQHQRDERQESEEGLDVLPSEQSMQFVSINGEAACDYVGDMLSDSLTRYGVSATYVKLLTQRALFCEDHSPRNGDPLCRYRRSVALTKSCRPC